MTIHSPLGGKTWEFWTCTRKEGEPKGEWENEGNYIRFDFIPGERTPTLQLNMVYTRYCTPALDKCRCKSLLESLLDKRPEINRIIGKFLAKPAIAGCKCYLGAAARKGFKYLKMYGKGENKRCQGKRRVTVKHYDKICNKIVLNKCSDAWAEITKLDPDGYNPKDYDS